MVWGSCRIYIVEMHLRVKKLKVYIFTMPPGKILAQILIITAQAEGNYSLPPDSVFRKSLSPSRKGAEETMYVSSSSSITMIKLYLKFTYRHQKTKRFVHDRQNTVNLSLIPRGCRGKCSY